MDEFDVGEFVEVTGLAHDEETCREAGPFPLVADLRLLLAGGVHPFREIRPAAAAVDQIELARWVERTQPVASGAAQPTRER